MPESKVKYNLQTFCALCYMAHYFDLFEQIPEKNVTFMYNDNSFGSAAQAIE